MRYRKKPVVIDAWKWTGKITDELKDIVTKPPFASYVALMPDGTEERTLCIRTLEGEMTVSIGDYIIRGVNGEYYPCKPDIFEKTYEKVEE